MSSSISAAYVRVNNGTVTIIDTSSSGVASLSASTVSLPTGTLTASNVNVNYLTINNSLSYTSVDISGNLKVDGSSSFVGAVTGGTLNLTTLTATGTITAPTVNTTTLTATNATVTGTATVTTANVSGTLSAVNTNVSGTETVNALLVTGRIDSSSGFAIDVSGNVTVPKTLNVNNSLNVSNNMTVSGNLVANESVSIIGNLDVSGSEYVGNQLAVNGQLRLYYPDGLNYIALDASGLNWLLTH
jgi:hypothetical protein